MPKVPCSKGCGDEVDVSVEDVQAALAEGRDLTFAHPGTCPRFQDLTHTYQLDVLFYRVPKSGPLEHGLLLRTSEQVNALSFIDAFPRLTDAVNNQFVKLASVAVHAEEGYEDPDPDTASSDDEGK